MYRSADVEALPFLENGAGSSAAPAYAASKAALNRGTALLAAEMKARGVTVNAVDPGWCRTDMGGAAAPRSATDGALSILHLVESSTRVVGSGKLFSARGAPVDW